MVRRASSHRILPASRRHVRKQLSAKMAWIGAWPSGKATGFGPVILGSNPSAPASQCGLCGVISGCVRTADIPAG